MQWIRGEGAARAIYALTLFALVLSIAFPAAARQLFYGACGLALLAWLVERRPLPRTMWMLLLALAAYASYRWGHTVIGAGTWYLESDSEQVSVAIAQRFLMGCFLIGYLATRQEFRQAPWLGRALAAALALSLLYAGYAEYVLEQDRGTREQRATIFSYEIVAVYLVYLGLWLARPAPYRWMKRSLPALIALSTLLLVLWTQTRSALFGFFIGSLLLLLSSGRADKWRILGVGLLLSALVTAAAYPGTIQPRLAEARTDIVQYFSGENRATSIGIRFELWRASFIVFKEAPWLGVGYERRLAVIDEAIDDGVLDPVLRHYKTVNMHDELLEELSLRGLAGGVLLLAIYGCLAFLALARSPRNLPLLGLVFSYFFFGLTDVLFFSREATVVFLLVLALLAAQLSSVKRS